MAVQDMRNVRDHFTVMLMMLMSSYGFSVLGLTLELEILCTTSMPFVHLPNTVCLLSSHGCRREKKTHVILLHDAMQINKSHFCLNKKSTLVQYDSKQRKKK